MDRKIRMGMIGGSSQGFIGAVHRMAANLDGKIELVCGAFSSDVNRSKETGRQLFLPEDRIYSSYEEMISREKNLPASIRMDFVSIVTPNHLHFLPSRLALENGFHVICEKPLAFSLQEALHLEEIVKQTSLIFGLTHNYTGYPMVKEARALIQSGKVGKIRKVIAEYPQGWLTSAIEKQGQKQAAWRTNPAQAGISCCTADIGTHAENLIEYITGLTITEVAADVSTLVPDRELDDDANILIRFNSGAKGIVTISQVATGEENELKIRVYGDEGGIEWLQSDPNRLILKSNSEAKRIICTGSGKEYLSNHALNHTRLPGGHPEGYIESLANLYRNFAFAVASFHQDKSWKNELYDFPGIEDGVRGMKFIEAVIRSGKNNAQWISL